MLLLGTRNSTDQDLAVNALVDLGEVYRRYDKKGQCGYRAFEFNGPSILLQQAGIYHLTAVIEFTAGTTGDATFQLAENGVLSPVATATDTVATATTEFNNVVLDVYILVNNNITLNTINATKSITIVNTGIATTVTNIVVNIEKVA